MKFNKLLLTLFLGCLATFTIAQSAQELADGVLRQTASEYNLSTADLADWIVTDEHISSTSKVHHIYTRQRFQGVEIYNADASIHIKNGKLITHHNKFISDVASKIETVNPNLNQIQAIESIAEEMDYEIKEPISFIEGSEGVTRKALLSTGGISRKNIPARLMYHLTESGALRLTWDMSILETNDKNWWSFKVDAVTGEILKRANWVVECTFEHSEEEHTESCRDTPSIPAFNATNNNIAATGSEYNVFPLGIESPNHGSRTIVTDPADATASPFGWHDTNGAAGAEFTITRGNNVHAQEDQDGNNGTGYSPDGGASLHFDFPLDLNELPKVNEDAMITNLFYWNNVTHDILYQYGFTEASGNFQQNNYGNGGLGNDYVFADAQDGSGLDNANFGTPPDGENPRMQMFLWGGGTNSTFTVNAPAGITGTYVSEGGAIGLTDFNVTGDIVIVQDANAPTSDGCSAFTNKPAIDGSIALVDRGDCSFVAKANRARLAGAIAVIICNNEPGDIFAPGGTGGIVNTIPVIMISQGDCATIRAEIPTVNATLVGTPIPAKIDGDVDNGIVVHEYGHGISNRLTGGGSNVTCLNNQEQMGEGWSDIYGLLLTMQPGDMGTEGRGVGTYAIEEPVDGGGIRPFPYSTDMTINPHTYTDINGVSVPHGVGSVWCEMLWEMTWNLIDKYGYDNDFYAGSGGNNKALALITEGLKLQACNPGFVDGRDAILMADTVLYGGANSTEIWAAFAKRGLGIDADQGDSNVLGDETESFDVPTFDEDGDGVPNDSDMCPGFADNIDLNSNDIPDFCEECSGLPNDLTVATSSLPSDLYRAPNDITTQGTVVTENGSSSLFLAGNSITFSSGFHAVAGSEIQAYILDCPVSSDPLNDEDLAFFEANKANEQILGETLSLEIMPNPMKGTALIQYQVPTSGNVNIGIYSAVGQRIGILANNEWKEEGAVYQQRLDGADLNEGYYYILLSTDKAVLTKKVVILK